MATMIVETIVGACVLAVLGFLMWALGRASGVPAWATLTAIVYGIAILVVGGGIALFVAQLAYLIGHWIIARP